MKKWKITQGMLTQLGANRIRNTKIQAIKDLRKAIEDRGEFADLSETKHIVDVWWEDPGCPDKYFKIIKDTPKQPHTLQASGIDVRPVDNASETISRMEAAIRFGDEKLATAAETIRLLEAKIRGMEEREDSYKKVYDAMEEILVSHIEGNRATTAFSVSLKPTSPITAVLQLIHPTIKFYLRKP